MDFLSYWDKRIEANKRLFDNNPGIANFLFDECQLLYEHMTKENNELKRLLAVQSDLDLQGYEHMRVKELEEALRPMAKMWSATRAAFEKEGVALPPGILIEPSLTSKFSDISAEQLDAMVKALEETK